MRKVVKVVLVTIIIFIMIATSVSAVVQCPLCQGTNVTYLGPYVTYDDSEDCPITPELCNYRIIDHWENYGCDNSSCYYCWAAFDYRGYEHSRNHAIYGEYE